MSQRDPGEYIRNMALVATVGQVGCIASIFVPAGLLLGIWLDNLLGTKPAFTLILVLGSVPLSLIIMVYVALNATKRVTPPKKSSKSHDEGGRPL